MMICYLIDNYYMQGAEGKRASTLKITQDQSELMIQTQDLALQVIFSTPILEVTNYLEQLQKYTYRGALSSINLKVDQFDDYYSSTRQRIDSLYNTLVYRSVTMIHDLIVSLRFSKIQLWRQQTKITQGLRTLLFMKDLDPYNFKVQAFELSQKTVLDSLKLPRSKLKQGQENIKKLLSELKEVEANKMQQIFAGKVQFPYIAENKDSVELDPSRIYHSYLSYLQIKMQRADESLFRRHFAIHEEIIKFGQSMFDHNLKFQRTACILLKRYTEMLPNDYQTTNIAPTLKLQGLRQHDDADQLLPGKHFRSESRPALVNRNMKVEFKQANRVLDLSTMGEELVQQIDHEQRQHFQKHQVDNTMNRQSPFQTFTERRRLANKDYFQNRDLQKKIREDDMRMNQKQFLKDKERVVIRRIIRATQTPAPWSEFADYESPFVYFLINRLQREDNIWDLRGKAADKVIDREFRREKAIPREEKGKVDPAAVKLEKQIQENASREQAFAFEDRRYKQEAARLARIKPKMVSRTYEKFMAMSKMEGPARTTETEVKRYGLTIQFPLKNEDDLDRFYFFYYKQRFYRENDWIKENADNPIIYLDPKKVNMNSAPKVVGQLIGSLVKRVQTMSFFLLWSDYLIAFRLEETKQKKIGHFECYSYWSSSRTCHKIIYQLRRRTNLQIKQKIYNYDVLKGGDYIMSKMEVAHRLIFDRHRPMPSPIASAMKGRHLGEQIFEELRNE